MEAQWRIELLGGLRVRSDAEEDAYVGMQKVGPLLAYLAYFRRQAPPRELLCELLWPGIAPSVSRNRLRTALAVLRHLLEPAGVPPRSVLLADRFTVQLSPATTTTDIEEFEAALRQTDVGAGSGAIGVNLRK